MIASPPRNFFLASLPRDDVLAAREVKVMMSKCGIPGTEADTDVTQCQAALILNREIQHARQFGFYYENRYTVWSVWVAIDQYFGRGKYSQDTKHNALCNSLMYLKSIHNKKRSESVNSSLFQAIAPLVTPKEQRNEFHYVKQLNSLYLNQATLTSRLTIVDALDCFLYCKTKPKSLKPFDPMCDGRWGPPGTPFHGAIANPQAQVDVIVTEVQDLLKEGGQSFEKYEEKRQILKKELRAIVNGEKKLVLVEPMQPPTRGLLR